MRYTRVLFGFTWVVAGAVAGQSATTASSVKHPILDDTTSEANIIDSSSLIQSEQTSPNPKKKKKKKNLRRDSWPMNCHIHNWPSASVSSIKQAYSWFYEIASDLGADAQQCRRIACFDSSAVWFCADSLDYKYPNSVLIADTVEPLLDEDYGCLDAGDKNMVQGQMFTSDGWCVLVRGGENCAVEVPEQPIFY
ncbi:hypothetical protein GGS20DRAFT_594455 [Poronia punctata]|nr:hypothetical protein GGS20DRAFT_594455 [Poronia punctata]